LYAYLFSPMSITCFVIHLVFFSLIIIDEEGKLQEILGFLFKNDFIIWDRPYNVFIIISNR
jgi:hypothetical protein